MAGKTNKPRTVTLEVPPELDSEPDPTPQEIAAEYAANTSGMSEDDADELIRGLDELRATAGVVFQVYRTEPAEREGFCRDYPALQFSVSRVAKDYGDGVYRIRIKGPGGKYIPGGGTMKIAASLIEPENESATNVTDMLALLKADRDKQSSNMKEWAAILAPLLAPVVANLFSGKSQVTELVTALGALQGLQPKADKPPDMMSQLDQLSGVLGKLKEMSGTESNSTGATWIDLVRDAIQGAKPVIEGIAAKALAGRAPLPSSFPTTAPLALMSPLPPSVAPSASAPVAPVAPGSSPIESSLPPATSAPPVASPQSDPMLQLLGWLKATAEQLAVQASRDKDPEFYAEVVADNLPDGTKPEEILQYLAREDWWPMFANFAPAVAPYQGWFQQFRDAFIEILRGQLPKPAPVPPPDPVPDPEIGD